ncbi:universal stress protein [Trichloromonas sp.]|uniref:universal stress protein n=1 Tax=Trichloromonas sp. TaxID=3069249 RepID=UPI003D818812
MIPQYGKILYATDLSVNAAHAFRHAISLARHYGAKIHVLHVLPEVDSSVLNYISTVMGEERLVNLELAHKDEITDQIRMRLHQFAKDELADHPEDLEWIADIEVHHGSPVGQILEVADRLDVDLVVVGSHGKGKLKYAFLGSVAEKLLRKSYRPVMVVPLND